MIVSKKGIAKALISLRECAGWGAPLLFVNLVDRYSHVEAYIKITVANVTLQYLSSSMSIRNKLLSYL